MSRIQRTAAPSEGGVTTAKKPLAIVGKEIEVEGTTENKIPESDLSLLNVVHKTGAESISGTKTITTVLPVQLLAISASGAAEQIEPIEAQEIVKPISNAASLLTLRNTTVATWEVTGLTGPAGSYTVGSLVTIKCVTNKKVILKYKFAGVTAENLFEFAAGKDIELPTKGTLTLVKYSTGWANLNIPTKAEGDLEGFYPSPTLAAETVAEAELTAEAVSEGKIKNEAVSAKKLLAWKTEAAEEHTAATYEIEPSATRNSQVLLRAVSKSLTTCEYNVKVGATTVTQIIDPSITGSLDTSMTIPVPAGGKLKVEKVVGELEKSFTQVTLT